MGKELELLQKMDLTAENRQKLEALITEAKKTGSWLCRYGKASQRQDWS